MPNKWIFEFEPKAEKQYTRLSTENRVRVFRSIQELIQSDNPTMISGVKHMQGTSNPKLWRQRQGDYRIIFSLETDEGPEMSHPYRGRLIIHEIAIHHPGY